MAGKAALHRVEKIIGQQLCRGNIHRQVPRLQPGRQHGGKAGQCRVHHLAPQRLGQPHILGQRNKFGRGHPFAFVPPARQRFEPHHAAIGQPLLRLQGGHQLPPGYGLAQRIGQPRAAHHPVGQFGAKQHMATPPLALGIQQCGIGIAQQFVRSTPLGRERRDAHRKGRRIAAGPQPHRPAQAGEQAQRKGVNLVWRGHAMHNQRELITRKPRRHVASPDAALQAPANQAQQHVSSGMAQAVIHRLEEIDIEQHEDTCRAGIGQALQLLHQHVTIGQPGQRVFLGPATQFAFGAQQWRHVGADRYDVAAFRNGGAGLHELAVAQVEHAIIAGLAVAAQIIGHPRPPLLGRIIGADFRPIVIGQHLPGDDVGQPLALHHILAVIGQDVAIDIVDQDQPFFAIING